MFSCEKLVFLPLEFAFVQLFYNWADPKCGSRYLSGAGSFGHDFKKIKFKKAEN